MDPTDRSVVHLVLALYPVPLGPEVYGDIVHNEDLMAGKEGRHSLDRLNASMIKQKYSLSRTIRCHLPFNIAISYRPVIIPVGIRTVPAINISQSN